MVLGYIDDIAPLSKFKSCTMQGDVLSIYYTERVALA